MCLDHATEMVQLCWRTTDQSRGTTQAGCVVPASEASLVLQRTHTTVCRIGMRRMNGHQMSVDLQGWLALS